MTAKIIDLKKERDDRTACWRCDCGCITHYVLDDGRIQCAACDTVATDLSGFWLLSEAPKREVHEDEAVNINREFPEPDKAFNHTLRFLDHRATAAIVVLLKNGTVRVWGGVSRRREDRGWLRRKLEIARGMLIE